jgi:hypothetical protein
VEAGSRCPGNAVQEISLHGAGKFPARRSKGLRYGVSEVGRGGVKVDGGGSHAEGGRRRAEEGIFTVI